MGVKVHYTSQEGSSFFVSEHLAQGPPNENHKLIIVTYAFQALFIYLYLHPAPSAHGSLRTR